MATKNRPLMGMVTAVREFEGGPQPLWYQIRGHVDRDEFVRELRLEYSISAIADDVKHEYARLVPAGPSMPGVMTQMKAKAGQRGAFPVTTIDAGNVQEL